MTEYDRAGGTPLTSRRAGALLEERSGGAPESADVPKPRLETIRGDLA